jgi:hypothetical protein
MLEQACVRIYVCIYQPSQADFMEVLVENVAAGGEMFREFFVSC